MAFKPSPNKAPKCMTTMITLTWERGPALVYFAMTPGAAGPGNLHLFHGFAGHRFVYSYDFLPSLQYLASNSSI